MFKLSRNKKTGQATLEISLFMALMIVVLLAALNYKRNLFEQNQLDSEVFQEVMGGAYEHEFTDVDLEGEPFSAAGASMSISRNVDRQANNLLLSGPQRRSSASSYSVYWSNAENPPDISQSYYNEQLYEPQKKWLDLPRDNSAEGDRDEDWSISTWDYIAIAAPPLVDLLGGKFAEWFDYTNWWDKWGDIFTFGVRAASFAYFLARYYDALGKIDDTEARLEALEEQDEQMGVWGWHVANKKDEDEGRGEAGKVYLKEISAQVWDAGIDEVKGSDYSETITETTGSISGSRSIDAAHATTHKIFLRFDETAPDPTIPLADHRFSQAGSQSFAIDLGGGSGEAWSVSK